MSVTSVQIQLPSFSHSFNVSVPSASTVLDFKQEICRTCIGSPNAAGQRVIYKGRVLDDTEIVGQVWKVADEPHMCHLAVHPSAWTTAPPNTTPSPGAPIAQPHPAAAGSPPLRAATANAGAGPPQMMHVPSYAAYSYIQYMHINALRILARQATLPWPEQFGDMDNSRATAKRGIELTGRGWPMFLNQDFPNTIPDQSADEGVKYASIFIDNLPYMTLLTPDATPTPLQAQAIRVLSYTFPLLCVYPPQVQHNNLQVIPPRPLGPLGVPVRGALPQFPIRPLIVPLILLTIRTTLLLYFFQPARKPLFGLMVFIWVTWEVMGAVRGVLGGENGNANGPNNRAEAPGNANVPPAAARPGVGAEARPDPGNGNNAAPPAAPASQEAVLNRLAHIDIAAEAPFAEPNATPDPNAPPPSLPHKIKVFFALLFLTLHPAIWDRRRTALRAREGRVREEVRLREARTLQREREREEREENRRRGADGNGTGDVAGDPVADAAEPPPPALKPFWVTEYVQRVRSGDWVDE